MPDWTSVKEAALLLVLLIVGNGLSMILGGVFWMIFGSLFAVPYFGQVVKFFFKTLFKLAVLFKLVAWCIGASGLLWAYLIFQRLYGAPDTIYEWWIIAGAAAHAILSISHDIIMLEFYDVEATLLYLPRFSPKFLKERMPHLDSDEVSHLIRRNFADINFSNLLRLLVSFGMLFFALSNLRVLNTKTGEVPTLPECLGAALSLISLVPSDVTFTGPVWLGIRLFAGIVLFVWVVVFVTLAINSLPNLQAAMAALGIQVEKGGATTRADAPTAETGQLGEKTPVTLEPEVASPAQVVAEPPGRPEVRQPLKKRSRKNRQGKKR